MPEGMEVFTLLLDTQSLEISGKPPAYQSSLACANHVLQIREQFLATELTYLLHIVKESKFQQFRMHRNYPVTCLCFNVLVYGVT